MKLPEDILGRSPEEAARRIALGFLEQADAAAARLGDESDAEALHDFRVAIRRLRSTVRAWRPYLDDAVSKKHRRALKSLQEITGGGRDAEVLLEWLAPQRQSMQDDQRLGLDWLVDRLRQRRSEGYAKARDVARRAFADLRGRLTRRLSRMTVEVRLDREDQHPTTWGAALAVRIRQHTDALFELLARVHSIEDRQQAHDARIAGKRLRYLIEPARPFTQRGADLVKQLKGLQDVLGELHDATVLLEELGRSAEQAAGERARRMHELAKGAADEERLRRETAQDERPGLIELTRRAQERMQALFEELERDWLGEGADAFRAAVAELIAELEGSPRQDLEIERKYLLSSLPEGVHGHPVVEIDQGYLPGDRLRERIRKVRHATGIDYKRTVKLGSGITRFEIDEATTEEVFAAMWPLTAGCRVQKRRWEVPEGELTWEIDAFTDRELYLAEVELPSADVDPPIPEWLRPFVVREVTEDPDYVNLNLAR